MGVTPGLNEIFTLLNLQSKDKRRWKTEMREGGSGDEMIPKKILEKMTTEKGRHF